MNSTVITQMAVIANAVTQSMTPEVMDRHASLAMTKSLFKVRVRYRTRYAALSMNSPVIANEVTQSMSPDCMDCRATLAVTASLSKVRVRYWPTYGGLAMTEHSTP